MQKLRKIEESDVSNGLIMRKLPLS